MHASTFSLAVGAGALAMSGVAAAGGLSMTYVGDASGRTIGIHHDPTAAWDAGPATSFSTTAFAGARDFMSSGRRFRTFATRIADSFAIGDTIAYLQVDPGVLPGGNPSTPAIGPLRADLLSDLYGRYWSFAATDVDPTFVAGFQLAIWEITHENITGSTREDAAAQLTLDLGAFQVGYSDTAEAFSAYVQANMMLASLGNGPFLDWANLRGWSGGGPLDRLAATVVPLPAPALLAATGLFAIGSRRRNR